MKATKKLALVCAALAAAAFGFVSCSSDDDSDYDDNVKLVVLARQPTSWNGASYTVVATDSNGNSNDVPVGTDAEGNSTYTYTYGKQTTGFNAGETTSSVIDFAFNGTFTQTDLSKTDDNNYYKTVTTGTFSGFPALSNQNITFNVSSITVTSVDAGVSTEKTYSSSEDMTKQTYIDLIKSGFGDGYDESKVSCTIEGASETITGKTDGNKQLTVTNTSVSGKLTLKYDGQTIFDAVDTGFFPTTTTTTVYNKQ